MGAWRTEFRQREGRKPHSKDKGAIQGKYAMYQFYTLSYEIAAAQGKLTADDQVYRPVEDGNETAVPKKSSKSLSSASANVPSSSQSPEPDFDAAAAMLGKDDAMAVMGDLWDEAKWEAAEKDEQGKVRVDHFIKLPSLSARRLPRRVRGRHTRKSRHGGLNSDSAKAGNHTARTKERFKANTRCVTSTHSRTIWRSYKAAHQVIQGGNQRADAFHNRAQKNQRPSLLSKIFTDLKLVCGVRANYSGWGRFGRISGWDHGWDSGKRFPRLPLPPVKKLPPDPTHPLIIIIRTP